MSHPRRARWSLVVAVAATAACQGEVIEPGGATDRMQELESSIVFGMVAYMSANGVREGRIEADSAYTFADSSAVDLHGMTAVFFDENGNERATVVGREGVWDQETDRMVARGDVVLNVHTDGSRIESAEIHYDPEGERVWSDSATVQTLANGSVRRGASFESDIEFQNVVIREFSGVIEIR